MDLNNLTSRLKREFLRNKKKSAILVIGSLVAIYFWAPLIIDWLPFSEATPEPATVAVMTPQATAEATAKVVARKPTLDWLKLSRTMAADLMMEPVHVKLHRSPFARAPAESLVLTTPEATAEPKPKSIKPGAAIPADEIKLTSIMIGPAFSEAVIDGETYTVDDELDVAVDLTPETPPASVDLAQPQIKTAPSKVRSTMKARIVEIHPGHVLLVLNHRMRKLPLYQPLTSGMTIKRNSP